MKITILSILLRRVPEKNITGSQTGNLFKFEGGGCQHKSIWRGVQHIFIWVGGGLAGRDSI